MKEQSVKFLYHFFTYLIVMSAGVALWPLFPSRYFLPVFAAISAAGLLVSFGSGPRASTVIRNFFSLLLIVGGFWIFQDIWINENQPLPLLLRFLAGLIALACFVNEDHRRINIVHVSALFALVFSVCLNRHLPDIVLAGVSLAATGSLLFLFQISAGKDDSQLSFDGLDFYRRIFLSLLYVGIIGVMGSLVFFLVPRVSLKLALDRPGASPLHFRIKPGPELPALLGQRYHSQAEEDAFIRNVSTALYEENRIKMSREEAKTQEPPDFIEQITPLESRDKGQGQEAREVEQHEPDGAGEEIFQEKKRLLELALKQKQSLSRLWKTMSADSRSDIRYRENAGNVENEIRELKKKLAVLEEFLQESERKEFQKVLAGKDQGIEGKPSDSGLQEGLTQGKDGNLSGKPQPKPSEEDLRDFKQDYASEPNREQLVESEPGTRSGRLELAALSPLKGESDRGNIPADDIGTEPEHWPGREAEEGLESPDGLPLPGKADPHSGTKQEQADSEELSEQIAQEDRGQGGGRASVKKGEQEAKEDSNGQGEKQDRASKNPDDGEKGKDAAGGSDNDEGKKFPDRVNNSKKIAAPIPLINKKDELARRPEPEEKARPGRQEGPEKKEEKRGKKETKETKESGGLEKESIVKYSSQHSLLILLAGFGLVILPVVFLLLVKFIRNLRLRYILRKHPELFVRILYYNLRRLLAFNGERIEDWMTPEEILLNDRPVAMTENMQVLTEIFRFVRYGECLPKVEQIKTANLAYQEAKAKLLEGVGRGKQILFRLMMYSSQDLRPKTEDRRRKTEVRRQKTEDRRQKTEDRSQKN